MIYSPTDIARQLRYIREATGGQNTGLRVQAIQLWCGGSKGESWCCYFVTLVLDICFQGNSPIERSGVCQEVYDLAKTNGWLTEFPMKDDLFFYVDASGHAHHIGIVTNAMPVASVLTGIAGNTSEDGKSSNGTGVFEHAISAKVFVRVPRG